jgi:hypothetical protein
MGQLVMVGTLAAVIAVIVGLVLGFDPEARRRPRREHRP